MENNNFSEHLGLFASIVSMFIFVWVVLVFIQYNPFVPTFNIYNTNTTDTITVSEKILDVNNNWYEIITNDNKKYLTDPRNLSEQVEINHTYSVVIKKEQIKFNIRGGMWQNTTYITSLELIGNEE